MHNTEDYMKFTDILRSPAFVLNDNQVRSIREWQGRQLQRTSEHPGGPVGMRWSYEFTSTSVGRIVTVKDLLLGEEFDATDFDSW
jgi:hypothetical protein